mmetsp:Transcript_12345/g.18416  ORF Transcript_12345/g.18416 Transcript_12345/m.18416 type:complete len:115 (+) Transcript_12345:139-483(+)
MDIIVMGGSCFVGRDLVEALTDVDACGVHGIDNKAFSIFVINRGTTYWRNCSGTCRSDIPKGAKRLKCDREDVNRLTRKIKKEVLANEKDRKVAVIDFCAYKPDHIRPLFLPMK